MADQRNSTRQRLIHSALELFATHGVTETTTKQIAELAEVNEVTLFRQFGNKHGLLLAVMQEAAVFTQLGQALVRQASESGRLSSIDEALRAYATAYLQALEAVPAVVRSVVGEAGQYPVENRAALGKGLTQANRYVADYFAMVIEQRQLQTHLPAEKLASLLNGMLLGYAVIEFTSEFHELWQNRDDFLDSVIALFLNGAFSSASQLSLSLVSSVQSESSASLTLSDLSVSLVHSILQKSKKSGLQDYAIAYVLFGAGLSPVEIISLHRRHYISDASQQLLQVAQGARQVPVNQWILGKRYGSYTRNPLTQWLKSRKDNEPSLFISDDGKSLLEVELRQRWNTWTDGLLTPEGHPPAIAQAQQTWRVELLMRGMSLDDLQLLTGCDRATLEPYAKRAREKTALEQAIRLDQKP
ncbi:MAG: TetR family transcriptional regulator [Leptolyngbya sp.]|nr:MAG: TetR family transcriptional regulator [Leptolyngbya sp.]